MNETQALVKFWRLYTEGRDRLELLNRYAAIVINRPRDWDYAGVRAERARAWQASECFCCRHRDRVCHWHHIIQVQNGGSNHSLNIVGLCGLCHARVHPWLPKQATPRRRWLSLGELMRRAKSYVTRRGAESKHSADLAAHETADETRVDGLS